MAQLALASGGALLGGAIGGPIGAQIGWLAGSFIGAQLFGEGIADEVNMGPRLGELEVGASTYGKGINKTYGSVRVAGNMIWGTDIVEVRREDSDTVGGKGGGGGQTVTQVSFSYFGQFAMAFAEGPVDSIRRVWADGKLLVDLGESTAGQRWKYSQRHYRAYLGDETQLPDTLIESIEGSGQVSAHRGLVYMVFDNLPLVDFGNRIPNITAEIVNNATSSDPLDLLTGSFGVDTTLISFDTPFMYNQSGGTVQKINRYNKEIVLTKDLAADPDMQACADGLSSDGPFDSAIIGSKMWIDMETNDVFIIIEGRLGTFDTIAAQFDRDLVFKNCYLVTPSGLTSKLRHGRTVRVGINRFFILAVDNPFGGSVETRGPITESVPQSLPVLSQGSSGTLSMDNAGFALDPIGRRAWVRTWNDGPQTSSQLVKIGSDLLVPFDDRDTGAGGSNPIGGAERVLGLVYDTVIDRVVMISANKIEFLDPETMDLIPSETITGAVSRTTLVDNLFSNQESTSGTLYTQTNNGQFHCWDLVNKKLIQTFNFGPEFPLGFTTVFFDPVLFAIWDNASTQFTRIFLDRVAQAGVSLSSIVLDISDRAGIPNVDIDAADLNATTVIGYVIPRPITARAALEPLRQAFFFDGLESDFLLKYRSRNRGSILNIPDDDLIVSQDGGGRQVALTEPRQQELEIPRRITVAYMHQPIDYNTGTQKAQRIQGTVGSTGELNLTFPIVMTNDQAAQTAMRALGSAWTERQQTDYTLSMKHIRLDPTDVVTIQKTATDITVDVINRITDADLGGAGQQRLRGVALDQDIFTPNVLGSPVPGAPSGPIPFAVPSRLMLFNLSNLRQDAGDNDGGFYVGAAPDWFLDNIDWRGTVYFRAAEEDGSFTEWLAVTDQAQWLISATVAPDGNRWTVWDEVNTFDVMVQGTAVLSTKTDLEVLAGANLILMGDELISFKTATLVSDDTYRLGGLLRGRLGTNLHMTGHRQAESGLIIDRAVLVRASSLNERTIQKWYKPTTIGQDIGGVTPKPFTNTSECFRPWSPAFQDATRDGSDNLTVTWHRRTRHSGEWLDSVDVPLHEPSQSYEVDVLDVPGGTVLRTFTGLVTETVAYTAAEQVTDGFTAGDPIPMEVFQINTDIGRGYPLVRTM